MQDSILIGKLLNKEFKDDSPAIYLYCCGNLKSQSTAINKALTVCKEIFKPFIDDDIISHTIEVFFINKKNDYMLGYLFPKPIY